MDACRDRMPVTCWLPSATIRLMASLIRPSTALKLGSVDGLVSQKSRTRTAMFSRLLTILFILPIHYCMRTVGGHGSAMRLRGGPQRYPAVARTEGITAFGVPESLETFSNPDLLSSHRVARSMCHALKVTARD